MGLENIKVLNQKRKRLNFNQVLEGKSPRALFFYSSSGNGNWLRQPWSDCSFWEGSLLIVILHCHFLFFYSCHLNFVTWNYSKLNILFKWGGGGPMQVEFQLKGIYTIWIYWFRMETEFVCCHFLKVAEPDRVTVLGILDTIKRKKRRRGAR